jgi:8-oxo-dGTP pyrophosphatase MutT (NUDIX family)
MSPALAPAPAPAATVLLVRGDPPGALFMVRRGHTAAFMARAMVFPGGKVDAADAELAHRSDLTPTEAGERLGLEPTQALAFFVAAARETFEEAGVLLATRGGVPVELSKRLVEHRWALNEKRKSFNDILEAEDLVLTLSALTPHAWWVTPTIEPRRFDTRFFMATLPPGQVPIHDARETTAGEWLTPQAALDGYAGGTLELAPPTLRILLDLLENRPPTLGRIEPQAKLEGKEIHLLLPGDAEFAPPGPGHDRIVMRGGRWCVER